jgi:hypothetical protein
MMQICTLSCFFVHFGAQSGYSSVVICANSPLITQPSLDVRPVSGERVVNESWDTRVACLHSPEVIPLSCAPPSCNGTWCPRHYSCVRSTSSLLGPWRGVCGGVSGARTLVSDIFKISVAQSLSQSGIN